jgi:hypothetical protein
MRKQTAKKLLSYSRNRPITEDKDDNTIRTKHHCTVGTISLEKLNEFLLNNSNNKKELFTHE